MKRLFLVVLTISIMLVWYFFYSGENANHSSSPLRADSSPHTFVSTTTVSKKKPLATTTANKINMLEESITSCNNLTYTKRKQMFVKQNEFIGVVETLLEKGVSLQQILSINDRPTTYSNSYEKLILQAKMNFEGRKYNYATTDQVLNEWQGLSVVKGMDTQKEEIAELIKEAEKKNVSMQLQLKINPKAKRSDILALTQNSTFNHYFKSVLAIGDGSTISPSMLFISTGKQLPFSDFKQLAGQHNFTVNDIAHAIKSNLPNKHINFLIDHSSTLHGMPTAIQNANDEYKVYFNLADVAISEFNLVIIEKLKTKGVTPSNEANVLTGMDIALDNLPKGALNNTNLAKYIATIEYLYDNNYFAHGQKNTRNDGTEEVRFHSNFTGHTYTNSFPPSSLKQLVKKVNLVNNSAANIPSNQVSEELFISLKELSSVSTSYKQNSKRCEETTKSLNEAHNIATNAEAYNLIGRYKYQENAPQLLHEIDPALASMFSIKKANDGLEHRQSSTEKSMFTLFTIEDLTQAYEFVTTTVLTQKQTNDLFSLMLANIDESITIWQARISPKPPSNTYLLVNLNLSEWSELIEVGFDLTMHSQFNEDIFFFAAQHSTEALELLIENDYSPNFSRLGLDVFDLALEESYKQGALSKKVSLITPFINKVETNHFRRIARLKVFHPFVYEELISINKSFIPPEELPVNHFMYGM